MEDWFTYDMWLLAIFDHPTTGWYWYGGDEAPELWELTKHPKTVVEWMTRTFRECASLPELFTDEQIADGIDYIINNAKSSLSFAIYDIENGVPMQARLDCMAEVYTVYKDLFAPRCSPDLGHTIYNNRVINPLNMPCYMWWDTTPIHGHPDDPRYSSLDQAILSVMAKTLTIDSGVCCEGALHGLGHWKMYYPKEVEEIIDAFLAEDREVSRKMRSYALAARGGGVM
jgi:hypothetical protein